ncbi:hypothetical protein GR7B_00141 [Vibrio phage vB_VcorM_GR7B]|nr:hypothetical protein GR7B_00141 [Vibrio phage vB_VcorM_GR7B]
MAFVINASLKTEERYAFEKFMEKITSSDNSQTYDPFTSLFLARLLKLEPNGERYVGAVAEQRPDLLSYEIYRDNQYWSLLLYYNNISDFRTLTSELRIRHFALNDLENLYFRLQALKKSDVPQSVRL